MVEIEIGSFHRFPPVNSLLFATFLQKENITDVNVIALREEIAVLLGIPLDCVVIVGTEGSSVGVIVVVIINDHQIAIELIDIINNEWCRKPNNSGPGR